jgi:hypothetical protein
MKYTQNSASCRWLRFIDSFYTGPISIFENVRPVFDFYQLRKNKTVCDHWIYVSTASVGFFFRLLASLTMILALLVASLVIIGLAIAGAKVIIIGIFGSIVPATLFPLAGLFTGSGETIFILAQVAEAAILVSIFLVWGYLDYRFSLNDKIKSRYTKWNNSCKKIEYGFHTDVDED